MATGYTGHDPALVQKAGDTMTGPLVLPGNPTTSLQAAPKQYVDAVAGTATLDWFNVKSATYGAVGDGSHDDTSAINAAITAANAAGGGVVYIPRGTYKLTDALVLKSNVWLKGDGIAATVLTQTATNKHGIKGSNLELVGIESLMVDGPGSGTGRGINLDGTSVIYEFYVTMRNVMVRQFGDTGILIDDPVTCDLINVTSKENGAEGFFIECSDTGTVGTSMSMVTCYGHNNAGNGFRLYNMVYSTLTGCAADNNVNGYKIEACESVTMTGCGAEVNSGDSIQISGGNNISVFGAWLSESGTNGVHVTGSAHVVTLKGIKEFSSTHTPTFIKVDTGCTVTVENCKSDTRSNSFATGTTTVLADTSLNMTVVGTLTAGSGSFAAPAASAVGDTQAAGSATTFSRSDHKHAREAFGSATAQTSFGASSANGSASTLARSDHAHGTPTHDATAHSAIKLSDLATPSADVSLNSHKLTSVTDPASAQDAATKNYVDTSLMNALPTDVGLKAWAYDPASIATGQAITSGTIYLCGVYVRKSMTVSSLCFVQSAAGTSPTAGASWIGLYNSAGTKLADAALDSVLTSVGVKQVSISSQSLTPGLYWVAILQNATNQQGGTTNSVGGSQIVSGLGLTTGATSRYAVNGTGATTLPSSITPASNTSTGAKFFWVGLA